MSALFKIIFQLTILIVQVGAQVFGLCLSLLSHGIAALQNHSNKKVAYARPKPMKGNRHHRRRRWK